MAEYFTDRFQDLRDCAGVSVGAGLGLEVHARATQVFQVGAGEYRAYRAGTWRRTAGIWNQKESDALIAPLFWSRDFHKGEIAGDFPEPELGEGPWTSYGFQYVGLPGPCVSPFDANDAYRLDHGFWDIGLDAHLLLVGADAYLNPAEMLDFVLGWFGLDICGDDFEPSGGDPHVGATSVPAD